MDRRRFLGCTAGLLGLAGCGDASGPPPLPPGELLGPTLALGHKLRDLGAQELPPAAVTQRVGTLIVGGGVGGLAAGWKLAKSGYADFLIAELEGELGGNARAGRNAVSAYPLAAHYLPLPPPEAGATRELLAELGVLDGDPRALRPRYDERYLCAVPQERLYRNGWWEDGVLPQFGIAAAEQAQYRRFYELMAMFKARRDGGDAAPGSGRRAFALPMAGSSPAPDLCALDTLTMRDWLLAQGLDAPHLHWYVDYACRDDYGTSSAATSAWAGIHYFACRTGEAQDTAGDAVLTTPGGNAWLADGMARSIRAHAGERMLPGSMALRVTPGDDGVAVDLWQVAGNQVVRIVAQQLIWAAPLFVFARVLVGQGSEQDAWRSAAGAFSYAPWLVANLTLTQLPENRAGVPTAWDNVLYDSPSLGYVVATHQQMRRRPGATVLTYYRALSQLPPPQARSMLLQTSREDWAEQILTDLGRAHPDIRRVITRLDVVRHGHAMVRPLPGLIWGAQRRLFAEGDRRIQFAHADVSGLSLFEEAQYRGVLAAERTLQRCARDFTSSLS